MSTQNQALRLLLVLLPLFAWIYLTWVAPRPFFLAEDDPEHLTYYSALLVEAGAFPALDVHNPGLTTTYMAAVVRYLGRGRLDTPDALFPWLRLLTAVLSGFGLYLVARFGLARLPVGVLALALAPVLAWPSFLLFFDYFDPIAMQTPLGLLTITLCWRALTAPELTKSHAVGCGISLGICLATKFTFVPMFAAMAAATVVAASGGIRRRLAMSGLLMVTTVVTLCMVGFPILSEIPPALAGPLWGAIAAGTGSLEWTPWEWLALWREFIALNPPGTVATIAFATVFLGQLLLSRKGSHPADGADAFLLLMLAELAYTVAESDGVNPRGLRLSQPTALCLPFLVARVWIRTRLSHSLTTNRIVQAVAGILALWIVVPAVANRVERRAAFLESQAVIAEVTRTRLLELRRPGTRIAGWDGSPGASIGEESFHFWGNHVYARNRFDGELLRQYPLFAHVRLREAWTLASAEDSRREEPRVQGSAFGRPGRLWRRMFPRIEVHRPREFISGESTNLQISLIAIPDSELDDAGITQQVDGRFEPLMTLIESRLGRAVQRRERIGGVNWTLIEVFGAATPAAEKP